MDEKPANRRDDRPAKLAFCEELRSRGYSDPRVCASPADVIAEKDGVDWYFEIKFTDKQKTYFGAATLTEWAAAARYPDRFKFVIAYRNGESWIFDEYTPIEFMAFSYVPPYKVYFSVPLNKQAARSKTANTKRIYMTKRRLALLTQQFEELRALEE